jgi:hypothetical protein
MPILLKNCNPSLFLAPRPNMMPYDLEKEKLLGIEKLPLQNNIQGFVWLLFFDYTALCSNSYNGC